jgi:hypothetical protein
MNLCNIPISLIKQINATLRNRKETSVQKVIDDENISPEFRCKNSAMEFLRDRNTSGQYIDIVSFPHILIHETQLFSKSILPI